MSFILFLFLFQNSRPYKICWQLQDQAERCGCCGSNISRCYERQAHCEKPSRSYWCSLLWTDLQRYLRMSSTFFSASNYCDILRTCEYKNRNYFFILFTRTGNFILQNLRWIYGVWWTTKMSLNSFIKNVQFDLYKCFLFL